MLPFAQAEFEFLESKSGQIDITRDEHFDFRFSWLHVIYIFSNVREKAVACDRFIKRDNFANNCSTKLLDSAAVTLER